MDKKVLFYPNVDSVDRAWSIFYSTEIASMDESISDDAFCDMSTMISIDELSRDLIKKLSDWYGLNIDELKKELVVRLKETVYIKLGEECSYEITGYETYLMYGNDEPMSWVEEGLTDFEKRLLNIAKDGFIRLGWISNWNKE